MSQDIEQSTTDQQPWLMVKVVSTSGVECKLHHEFTFDDDVIVRRARVRTKRKHDRHSLFVLPSKIGSSIRSLSPFRHRRGSLHDQISISSSKCCMLSHTQKQNGDANL